MGAKPLRSVVRISPAPYRDGQIILLAGVTLYVLRELYIPYVDVAPHISTDFRHITPSSRTTLPFPPVLLSNSFHLAERR